MTLNGVIALVCVISPNSVASGAHCIKVVEDVVVKKFTFAISSPGEFLVLFEPRLKSRLRSTLTLDSELVKWQKAECVSTDTVRHAE